MTIYHRGGPLPESAGTSDFGQTLMQSCPVFTNPHISAHLNLPVEFSPFRVSLNTEKIVFFCFRRTRLFFMFEILHLSEALFCLLFCFVGAAQILSLLRHNPVAA